MSGTKPILYWDACIYNAWPHQEEAYKEWLPAINTIAQNNKERKNIIITSAITLLEVLSLDDEKSQLFQSSFQHDTNQLIEVEMPIVIRAKHCREWHRSKRIADKAANKAVGKVIGSADAIHLATAAIYGAHEFHTFDDGGSGGCSLLKLSGDVAGDNLVIKRPEVAQGNLL